jgi:two-component system, NarL family, sensor histidine kinase UhpB
MKTLHVLFAGGDAHEAERIERTLSARWKTEFEQLAEVAALPETLRGRVWDVAVMKDMLGDPAVLNAVKLVRGWTGGPPLVLIADTFREARALDAVRAGAIDYVPSEDHARLLLAIERALHAHPRLPVYAGEALLREQQSLLEALMRYFPGVVLQLVSMGPQTYDFSLVSEGCFDLLELSPETLRADSEAFFRLLVQPDAATLASQMKRSGEKLRAVNWEGRLRTATTATIKWVNIRLTPRRIDDRVVWEGFMANITRNKQHEQEIVRSRKRLRELSSHLEKAKERERERIARELHDEIGGNLSAIKMSLTWLGARIPKSDAKSAEKMQGLEALVDDTASTIVRIGQDLRPGILDLGLVAAIEWQVLDFSKRMGITCDTDLAAGPLELDRDAEAALFSIFREMLTNVAKHANATEVKIRLGRLGEQLELAVEDNGKGMASVDRLKASSFGLRGMEERATQLGGSLTVNWVEPSGTCVAVRVPQPAPARGDADA